jgi:ribosome recycling factor
MNKNVETSNETQNPKLGISDVMHSDYQQKLFHEIVDMKHRMQGLAGFVQNDFDRMLNDGTTTKDDIKEAIEDMDKSFDKVINEMNTLREKCRVIMSYHCA